MFKAVKVTILVALVTILMFGIKVPVFADTTGPNFGDPAPADGKLLTSGSHLLEIQVSDPDMINAGSVEMLINGQKVPAFTDYIILEIDPVAETETYDYTRAIISYRQKFPDNLYNVEVRARDGSGNLSVKKWSFEVKSGPVFASPKPAPYSTVYSRSPKVSALISVPSGRIDPSGVEMKINGQQVPVFFDIFTSQVVYLGGFTGEAVYTPLSPLSPGEYTATLTATDTNGKSSSTSWTFFVDSPAMPVSSVKQDCLKCHTNMPAQHKMSNCTACHDVALRKIYEGTSPLPHFVASNCSSCHDTVNHETAATPDQPAWYPIDQYYSCEQCHSHSSESVLDKHQSSTSGTCQECHSTGLTQEHFKDGRVDESGSSITCFTCHNSSNDLIKNAISSSNTACEACHTTVTHTAVHNNPSFTALAKDSDMNCSDCHKSSISDEHTSGKFSSSKGYTCGTCHDSLRTEVKAAIAANNLNCEACHIDSVTSAPKFHTSSGSPLHDSIFVVSQESECLQCHDNNLKTVHVGQPNKLDNNNPMSCATCHESSNPAVLSAINANNTNCDTCHTTRHNGISHSFPEGYVLSNPANMNCAGCHQGSSLTDLHIGKVSGSGEIMSCNTCHGITASDTVKSAIISSQTNCEACHVIHRDSAQAHNNTAYTALPVDPDMNCSGCHNSSISDEHINGKLTSGKGYTCGTCHDSLRTEVKAAIAANNLNCEACHSSVHTSPNPYHATAFVINKNMACEKCHNANSIAEDHAKYKTSSGQAITCQTCHDSADNLVKTAISSGTTGCDNCHVNRHSDVNLPHKTIYIPNLTYNCINCHPAASIGYTQTQSFHRVSGLTPNVNNLHGGIFVSPWTVTSTVECRGCHGPNPTNGNYYSKLLKGNYTVNTGMPGYTGSTELCFLCHSASYYSGTAWNQQYGSGFKMPYGTNLHTAFEHGTQGCQFCHSRNVHSSSQSHFIAIWSTTEPASGIYGFKHEAGYTYSNPCGSCHW